MFIEGVAVNWWSMHASRQSVYAFRLVYQLLSSPLVLQV